MDALLDPSTGDYTGTRTTTLANAVYLRLQTPLGSYWRDTALGSLLYTLRRSKDVPRIAMLAQQYAEQALQPLLDDARAQNITVTASQPEGGWLVLSISVVDPTGDTQTFQHAVKVI
ncbi:phage GP46 family protein [Paraburkholderia unamae]|uniref:Phage gp46-like protein n=1 Tax=Paraburkholderia unamae TaxID=219649 RepID=A0ABX5KID1_9BURK|nr:phage GP46 family protein [Paraburkholderia unamae]PVX80061.1 phage gp46-like protein [Paraburkholderia unamae]